MIKNAKKRVLTDYVDNEKWDPTEQKCSHDDTQSYSCLMFGSSSSIQVVIHSSQSSLFCHLKTFCHGFDVGYMFLCVEIKSCVETYHNETWDVERDGRTHYSIYRGQVKSTLRYILRSFFVHCHV